jgi:hypothetical protein
MNWRVWASVAAVVVAHGVIALFLGGSMHVNDLYVVVLSGWCVGQINLIAVWGALTPGPVLLRVPWSIVLGMLLWYALLLGNRFALQPDPVAMWLRWTMGPTVYYHPLLSLGEALILGGLLLAAIFCTQVPLWIAASRWGWRLLPPAYERPSSHNERQFHLRHLLLGMVAVSVAFALGRVVLPRGALHIDTPRIDDFVLLAIMGIVNLLVVMPCIWWATLRVDRMLLVLGGWLLYAGLISIMEVFVIGLLTGGRPGLNNEQFYIALFNYAQCACVFVTLLVLRWAGFRLSKIQADCMK